MTEPALSRINSVIISARTVFLRNVRVTPTPRCTRHKYEQKSGQANMAQNAPKQGKLDSFAAVIPLFPRRPEGSKSYFQQIFSLVWPES